MSASRRKDTDFDRDAAAYTLAEAARYVRLPAATLRSWVLGRQYPTAGDRSDFSPLIRPASRAPAWLSFSNLIEAHVLRSLRVDPRIAFGRPVMLRKCISTSTIAERVDAGESVDELAADYGLGPAEIEQAVVYERAA